MSAVATTRRTATPRSTFFHRTRHRIVEGYDPPEGWGWCYIDEVMLDLTDRATPSKRPPSRAIIDSGRACANPRGLTSSVP
jgi:hypothetical protein